MPRYKEYAQELEKMLHDDQKEWKAFWSEYFDKQNGPDFEKEFDHIRNAQSGRSARMLTILDAIKQPSISNVGMKGSQAISILALHDKLGVLRKVLSSFESLYIENREDSYHQAIPSMKDRVRILERKPQIFGTQWELDENGYPFLPTVEEFSTVNERRLLYGIEPLRWPKSLAIPESEQPWLKKPIQDAPMRDITDEEFLDKHSKFLK